MSLTSEQIRAARALLRWEQRELAARSGISLPSIKRIETRAGTIETFERTEMALRAAFEMAGIEFIDAGSSSAPSGTGVRLKGDREQS